MNKSMKALTSTLLQMLVLLLAANGLMLLTLVGGQLYLGKIGTNDLYAMLRVLKGTHQYVVSDRDINELQRLREAERRREERLAEQKGTGLPRYLAPAEATKLNTILQENYEALQSEIEAQKSILEDTRGEIARAKKQLEEERQKLINFQKQQAATRLSENRKKLERTLGNMDAEDIGAYLAQLLKTRKDGAYEAARYLRDLMPPALAAETLTEMADGDVQQILPLMENNYADRSPQDIVLLWRTEKLKPQQMAEYILRMPVTQAFSVYSLLEPADKAQVAQLLQEL